MERINSAGEKGCIFTMLYGEGDASAESWRLCSIHAEGWDRKRVEVLDTGGEVAQHSSSRKREMSSGQGRNRPLGTRLMTSSQCLLSAQRVSFGESLACDLH